VVTLAGFAPKLVEALIASVRTAAELIDVREHRGVHPRVGAADVVPIVPLDATPLSRCQEVARELGDRIWNELRVPVFFYGQGQSLADIRAGRGRLDLGGPGVHPTAGAVCVGARPKLVAFNVILQGVDADAARALARSLRESGGGMRGVHALVFELSGGRVQLSMNLFRLEETTPTMVVAELERRGVAIAFQQVVGLCPPPVAIEAAAGRLLEARLAAAAAQNATANAEAAPAAAPESVKDMSAATKQVLEKIGSMLKDARTLTPSEAARPDRAEAPAAPAQSGSPNPSLASAANADGAPRPTSDTPSASAEPQTALSADGAPAPR